MADRDRKPKIVRVELTVDLVPATQLGVTGARIRDVNTGHGTYRTAFYRPNPTRLFAGVLGYGRLFNHEARYATDRGHAAAGDVQDKVYRQAITAGPAAWPRFCTRCSKPTKRERSKWDSSSMTHRPL